MENGPNEKVDVIVIDHGPLMISATCEVTHADGSKEIKENRSAYCRCGASTSKPFCDGSHKSIDW